MSKDRRYWDANAFLGWFLGEPDKVSSCETVIRACERGECEIVTSAVTLTEVIKLKGEPPLKEADEQKIKDFFENDYILIAELTRFIGEKARHLIWKHQTLKPKDAIHLATAIDVDSPYLDTFDNGLLKLNGKLDGVLIHIGKPSLPMQADLELRRNE